MIIISQLFVCGTPIYMARGYYWFRVKQIIGKISLSAASLSYGIGIESEKVVSGHP